MERVLSRGFTIVEIQHCPARQPAKAEILDLMANRTGKTVGSNIELLINGVPFMTKGSLSHLVYPVEFLPMRTLTYCEMSKDVGRRHRAYSTLKPLNRLRG